MVLVDVDITTGVDDGSLEKQGYQYTGTGYTNTAYAGPANTGTTVEVGKTVSRYITGTKSKTQITDKQGYFLFKGITIPQGSTIDNATFNINASNDSGSGDFRVYGRLTASPTVPTTGTFFTKPVGTAFGNTSITATAFNTFNIDIQTVVQELVDAFDYNNDNMMIIPKSVPPALTGTGSTYEFFQVFVRSFEFGGATIPNLTINYTSGITPIDADFEVNALLQALGDNGQCPIPATETFYSRIHSLALAERLGEGVNSPFAGITRSGIKIVGSTNAGKAIADVECRGLRRNGVGATGSLFVTVRSQNDTIIAMSTNSILAESLPTSGTGILQTFTLDETVVLQDGYRILLEFPNCIGCSDSANFPNVFWFGTSASSPAGTARTFFGKSDTDSGSYVETTTGFTQGGTIAFTLLPAVPAEQRGCAEVDANLKGIDLEFDFIVDGFIFIPPAKLTLVSAIIAGEIEENFTIDSCLVNAPIFTFTVDACIQQSNNEDTFTVDGHVFILPVRNVLVDAIIRYAQGVSTLGGIPDLIIRALRENPPSLTGRGIVVKVVEITTGDPTIPFTGKTSRIKNWLNRLRLDGLIQEDGSDPDWFETNWSLV